MDVELAWGRVGCMCWLFVIHFAVWEFPHAEDGFCAPTAHGHDELCTSHGQVLTRWEIFAKSIVHIVPPMLGFLCQIMSMMHSDKWALRSLRRSRCE